MWEAVFEFKSGESFMQDPSREQTFQIGDSFLDNQINKILYTLQVGLSNHRSLEKKFHRPCLSTQKVSLAELEHS